MITDRSSIWRGRGGTASVYVITHDDIIRSDAVTIPEIQRLAPNLLVSQESPIGRGFTLAMQRRL